MNFRSKLPWLFIATFLVASCNTTTSSLTSIPVDSSLSLSPLPFEYITTPPENQFLLIGLGDDDWTCLDELCDCSTVEAAAPPFGISNGIFQIDPYYLENNDLDRSLLGTDLWPSIRKSKQSIGLLGFYGANTDIYLAYILSFPYRISRFSFEILGFDSQGSIQINTRDGYVILLPNESYKFEQSELRYENCKVQNILELKNYGFIDDNNVIFSLDFIDHGADFPP